MKKKVGSRSHRAMGLWWLKNPFNINLKDKIPIMDDNRYWRPHSRNKRTTRESPKKLSVGDYYPKLFWLFCTHLQSIFLFGQCPSSWAQQLLKLIAAGNPAITISITYQTPFDLMAWIINMNMLAYSSMRNEEWGIWEWGIWKWGISRKENRREKWENVMSKIKHFGMSWSRKW